MKGWKTALALGAAAAAAGAVAGEYFYRFALTQQIDKTAAFNACLLYTSEGCGSIAQDGSQRLPS